MSRRALSLSFLFLALLGIVSFGAIGPTPARAAESESQLYGCPCTSPGTIGQKGGCLKNQGCQPALENVVSGNFCYATPTGGYPLKACGEGCACKSDMDCRNFSFAGRCINSHCYIIGPGVFVTPIECEKDNTTSNQNVTGNKSRG